MEKCTKYICLQQVQKKYGGARFKKEHPRNIVENRWISCLTVSIFGIFKYSGITRKLAIDKQMDYNIKFTGINVEFWRNQKHFV